MCTKMTMKWNKRMKFIISSKFWSISIFHLLNWFKLRKYRRKGPGKPRVKILVLVSAFTKLVFFKDSTCEFNAAFHKDFKNVQILEVGAKLTKLQAWAFSPWDSRWSISRSQNSLFSMIQHVYSMHFFIRISKMSKVLSLGQN